MSIEKQLSKIEAMYGSNIKKMGDKDTRSVGWNTESCQKLRFSKLSKVIDSNEAITINDFGCGYGALLSFLVDELKCSVSEYNGTDISVDMIRAAKLSTRKQEEAGVKISLIESHCLIKCADYSIVSGTFNVKFDASNDDWSNYIKECLHNIDENSEKGFSFNMLTSYVDWKEDHLFYADPSYWFDFCKKNFSKNVSLYHDYDLYEWTIVVRK